MDGKKKSISKRRPIEETQGDFLSHERTTGRQIALRDGLLVEVHNGVAVAPAFLDKIAAGTRRAQTSWKKGGRLRDTALATLLAELIISNLDKKPWDFAELTDVTNEVLVHLRKQLLKVAFEARLIDWNQGSISIGRHIPAAITVCVGDGLKRPFRDAALRKLLFKAFAEEVHASVQDCTVDGKYNDVLTLLMLSLFQDQGAFAGYARAARGSTDRRARKKKRAKKRPEGPQDANESARQAARRILGAIQER